MAPSDPKDPVFETAHDAAEFLLEITGDALRDGDFDAYAERFALSNVISSPKGTRSINNMTDLRRVFDGIRALMAEKGDAEMIRTIISARFTGLDELTANHITCWIVDGVRIAAPYTCTGNARLIDGRWQIVRSSYLVKAIPDLAALLAGKDKKGS